MLAESDKMPAGLKLMSRHNVILYDSTWIAGVHNNKHNNKNNKDNDPYDDDEDDYDYDYEESSDLQENDMDEIDTNELGDLVQDTCNNMPIQEQIQENQENQQMISESEEECDSEEDYHEEENMEEENRQPLQLKSKLQ